MKRYLLGACIILSIYSCATQKSQRSQCFSDREALISFYYSPSLLFEWYQHARNNSAPFEVHFINGAPYTSFIDSVRADAKVVARLPLSQASFTSVTFYGSPPYILPVVEKKSL